MKLVILEFNYKGRKYNLMNFTCKITKQNSFNNLTINNKIKI